jgi:hypothetical protein
VWRELEEGAPELARLGRERLDRRAALLGTIRKDGSPRISPVEPFFVAGELIFGTMPWSLKVRDLERDPRCVLHSAVMDPDATEGELRLYGRAVEVDDPAVRNGAPNAWWVGRPVEEARVFALAIEEATFITWDFEGGLMTARRWSAEEGYREAERPYP